MSFTLDFSDVRRYQPGTHPGILLIRAKNRSAAAVTEMLARVIAEQSLQTLQGCLAVADASLTRIRRPSHRHPPDPY